MIANVSQYLFVVDDPATIVQKLKSGQTVRGIGVFARVGYAPQGTNPITRDASVALFASGLFRGKATVNDESGFEIFYDFAITPAVRLIPGYQHIWHPLAAQVAKNQNHADFFLARFTVAW